MKIFLLFRPADSPTFCRPALSWRKAQAAAVPEKGNCCVLRRLARAIHKRSAHAGQPGASGLEVRRPRFRCRFKSAEHRREAGLARTALDSFRGNQEPAKRGENLFIDSLCSQATFWRLEMVGQPVSLANPPSSALACGCLSLQRVQSGRTAMCQ